ncbi:MAG: phage portal protein [Bacteroidales bacterium]|jgi:HK97 family phage portal protein
MSKLILFGKPVFEFVSEKRSTPIITGNLADPTQALIQALGNNAVGSINVNVNTAITLSAVWRAINVISSTLAGLPLKHYKISDGGRENLRTSAASRLLKKPNEMMTGYMFRETLTALAVGYGNGYAYIKHDASGIPVELIPIHPSECLPIKFQNKIYYKILIDGSYQTVTSENVIHIPGLSFNGLVGYGVVTIARESLGGALATQKFGNKFYENGANIGGVLETPGELSDSAYKRLKESWNEKHHGVENTGSTAILEGGTKFTKIGIAPEEAQFLQTRQFQVTEVARWFGVPPHMLFDLERSTNNNIEQQAMEFVTYTLLPWANRWEEELSRKLVKSNAQDSEYIEHEFNGLLRGDSKSRAEYYKGLFGVASITPNQIAELENLPKDPLNGDTHYVQAAYAPVDKIAAFYEGKAPKDSKDTNDIKDKNDEAQ